MDGYMDMNRHNDIQTVGSWRFHTAEKITLHIREFRQVYFATFSSVWNQQIQLNRQKVVFFALSQNVFSLLESATSP